MNICSDMLLYEIMPKIQRGGVALACYNFKWIKAATRHNAFKTITTQTHKRYLEDL